MFNYFQLFLAVFIYLQPFLLSLSILPIFDHLYLFFNCSWPNLSVSAYFLPIFYIIFDFYHSLSAIFDHFHSLFIIPTRIPIPSTIATHF